MSLPSTMNRKAPAWIRFSDARLRTAALSFAALLLLDLVLYGVLVAPLTARLAGTEAQYSELRKRHADAILFERQKPSFSGIMAGVPQQTDMPILIKDLVQTAHRMHLAVDAIKYDIPKRSSGELALLAFSFPAKGSYGNVKRFIYNVETADRFVGIKDLKLDSEKGVVTMEMKLLTYIKGQ